MSQKILIIEDHQEVRENIAEMLSLYQFDTEVAENGSIGIDKAIKKRPQLIFCDIAMPNKDGFQVLRALKENPITSHIPFVFISAYAQEQEIERGRLAGADHYITKPFATQQLLDAIKKFIK